MSSSLQSRIIQALEDAKAGRFVFVNRQVRTYGLIPTLVMGYVAIQTLHVLANGCSAMHGTFDRWLNGPQQIPNTNTVDTSPSPSSSPSDSETL